MSTLELIDKGRKAEALGARVQLVGSWIWAEFESKPSLEARQTLLAEGYHWNHKRRCWQYAGVPCRHSPADTWAVKAKYGAQELEELESN